MNQTQQQIEELKKSNQQLTSLVETLSYQVEQLRIGQENRSRLESFIQADEFSLGNGANAIKMNSEGFWTGTRSFTEAIGVPPAGTAIKRNGDFYPKGGVSGTYVDGGGQTLTITRGFITGIAP